MKYQPKSVLIEQLKLRPVAISAAILKPDPNICMDQIEEAQKFKKKPSKSNKIQFLMINKS